MKQRNPVLRVLLSLLITVVLGSVLFYFAIPAVNLQSGSFYSFIIGLCIIYMVVSHLLGGGSKAKEQKDPKGKQTILEPDGKGGMRVHRGSPWRRQKKSGGMKFKSVPGLIIALCVVICIAGAIISAVPFHGKAYYNLLNVQKGSFAQDVAEISYNKIPMLDGDSAVQLGKRAMGSISENSNLVSQFEVSDNYTQINYKGNPVRVAPLEYGNIIKWLNNRSSGLPGYIVVNMVTQEAQLVQLKQGIKYSTCDHFNRNLYRYLRFCYPTFMFGDVNFEIDEQGTPYWVCSRVVKTIGLFGGEDVKGAVLVNGVTGACQYYEKVPSWVDRVYDASMIMNQYNYHGSLGDGWINSWLGQKGVTTTTEGYNYIAMNDDVYMYTGVTSAGSDQSNVGFVLVNQRTKEAKYYDVTGAEERSAMSSAEGAVQHLHYSATFPLLLNISNQPTYFMALKDSAELVKMYAMVNVHDYQITATGTTVAACQQVYENMLVENHVSQGTGKTGGSGQKTVTGTVAEIRSAVIDGNTWYYLKLKGEGVDDTPYYSISAAESKDVIILSKGDSVTITYKPGKGSILTADAIEVK